jgi:hypothetical protein
MLRHPSVDYVHTDESSKTRGRETMNEFIKKAARRNITLTPDDFVWEEGMGGWTLDGMVPEEWLEAMIEDDDRDVSSQSAGSTHSLYAIERDEVLACGE